MMFVVRYLQPYGYRDRSMYLINTTNYHLFLQILKKNVEYNIQKIDLIQDIKGKF